MEKQYLSIKDTAKKFDVSEKTIRRMIEEREIPFLRFGGAYRISIRHLEAWEQNKIVNKKTSSNQLEA